MKITSIKQQVKNPERVSIFVDGRYLFSLSLGELVTEKLKINADLTEAKLKRLKKLSEDGKLKNRALEWVMTRPRSKREFTDYLRRKKADHDLVEAWTYEFEKRGYMGDEKFTNWLIDMRRRQGKSERVIRSELFKKGVDREIATEILSDGEDETKRLKELVDKKVRLPRYKSDPQKLFQYLARQGFNYEDIKHVLSKQEDA